MDELTFTRTHMPEYDAMSDEDLAVSEMYRCGCGAAAMPTGDPNTRHCEQDS